MGERRKRKSREKDWGRRERGKEGRREQKSKEGRQKYRHRDTKTQGQKERDSKIKLGRNKDLGNFFNFSLAFSMKASHRQKCFFCFLQHLVPRKAAITQKALNKYQFNE